MNYKAFKRSMATAALGLGLWYGAGLSGYESTPGQLIDSGTSRRSTIEAIVSDAQSTNTPYGLGSKALTYGGLAGLGLSVIAPNKKKKTEE